VNSQLKKNCWEFAACGRSRDTGEPGCDVCPASTETKLDGIHGGKNAGRTCWVVAGTFCGGEVQGTFAKKCLNCTECNFYKTVQEEEGGRFMEPIVLLNILKEFKGPFPREFLEKK
jgi:hypothetical protein